MPTIGFLAIHTPALFAPFLAAFHEGLRETGYVEGQNVSLEYRWAEGRSDRLPALAADLVARNVDVITTAGGLLVARVAREATSSIPAVFETGTDPVTAGLVASMARPESNLTGIAILSTDLNPKRLELLTEMVPEARAIALLVNPTNAMTERIIVEVQNAARAKGVRVEIVTAATEDEFEPAFSRARATSALLVASDPVLFSHRGRLVALAERSALPAIYEWRQFAEIGGLMSYGASIVEMHRERGRYVGRVLSGAKPADLPVRQPTKFELVINLKTAGALGLRVPQSLLARTDEVIE